MKSVALLLYGQPRFLNNPISSKGFHEHIISKYDTKVFGHTWRAKEYYGSSWSQLKKVDIPDNFEEKLKELYPDITLQVEDSIDFHETRDLNNMYSQFYSIQQAGELFKNSTDISSFDWIILTRYDIHMESFVNLNGMIDGFYSSYHQLNDEVFIFSPKYLDFTTLYQRFKGQPIYEHNCIEQMKEDHLRELFTERIKVAGNRQSIIRNDNIEVKPIGKVIPEVIVNKKQQQKHNNKSLKSITIKPIYSVTTNNKIKHTVGKREYIRK